MPDSNYKNNQVTNFNYLTEVSKGDKAFMKEMMSLFLSENPEELKALDRGIRDVDYDLIQIAATKLRSSIPFVGLDKIIDEELIRVEYLAGERAGLSEIKQLYTKIKDACEKACTELQLV
jgi:HPt (histidine-containing phosphotransfer) domain-containing protein